MPLVCKPSSLTCRAERLARAGTGPYGPSAPASKLQGVGPSAESGEEVTLCIAAQFVWSDILNAPCVDVAAWDEFVIHQIA